MWNWLGKRASKQSVRQREREGAATAEGHQSAVEFRYASPSTHRQFPVPKIRVDMHIVCDYLYDTVIPFHLTERHLINLQIIAPPPNRRAAAAAEEGERRGEEMESQEICFKI